MLSVFGLATGVFILYYAFARCDRSERARLLVCSVLIVFTMGFWAFYEQMGSSLNLFADRMVDRVILGREIPASTLQALPSIFVILLAPPFGALWFALAKRGREPNTAFKFSLAIAFVAMAFFVLVFGTRLAGSGKVALLWFALNFLFLVMGELCLSPVGMSMVTKLAPQRVVGLMMGTFFLAYSGSSFIAGIIARLTSTQSVGGTVTDHATALATYSSVYTRLGLMAGAVAVLLLIISPLLRRGMEEPRAARPLAVAPESPA
jgi:POT family proton-dependent oligopeptide transporter